MNGSNPYQIDVPDAAGTTISADVEAEFGGVKATIDGIIIKWTIKTDCKKFTMRQGDQGQLLSDSLSGDLD